jgi:hypothetical protein
MSISHFSYIEINLKKKAILSFGNWWSRCGSGMVGKTKVQWVKNRMQFLQLKAEKVWILLARTGSPEVAESSEAAVVLPNGEEAPRRLPSGQDPAHLMQRLLPEIVGLQLEQHAWKERWDVTLVLFLVLAMLHIGASIILNDRAFSDHADASILVLSCFLIPTVF